MTSRIGRKDTKIIWSDERKIEKKLYFVLKFVDFCSFYIAITIYISEILVFSETKHIVIGKIELLFSDILDCVVDDDIKERETIQTFRGNSSATSKANTGNMIGRAVVGGVLLGGTGAIIGGSTANRHTIIEHGIDTSILDKTIEHNFTIAITVKDISNPVIYLNVGSNTRLKDEIVSLMKVIISMQTQ